MADNPFSKLELALDPLEPLSIGSAGSIASGKSTFISALHGVLGYHNAGIKIEKERLLGSRAKVKPQAYERKRRGIFRSNATDFPDFLTVYGTVEKDIYPFEFYAPGGHVNAVSLDMNVDALLYFLDLNLASTLTNLENYKWFGLGGKLEGQRVKLYAGGDDIRISECVNGQLIEREPIPKVRHEILEWIKRAIKQNNWQRGFSFADMAESWGFPGVKDKEDWADRLESLVDDIPPFGLPPKKGLQNIFERDDVESYKNEILGAVLQSLIDSYLYAKALNSDGNSGNPVIPVIGVGTHKNKVYGKLPNEPGGLLMAAQKIFNDYLKKFQTYQKENGLEGADISLDLTDGIAPSMPWFITDLMGSRIKGKKYKWCEEMLNTKNQAVLEIAHYAMAKALQYKGIKPGGLRLITFSRRQSELTVPYSAIKQ